MANRILLREVIAISTCMCFYIQGHLQAQTRYFMVQTAGPSIPIRLEIPNHAPPYRFIALRNGSERIELNASLLTNDSAIYPLHVFDGQLTLYTSASKLHGTYTRFDTREGTRRLAFTETSINLDQRLTTRKRRYAAIFSEADGTGVYQAIGHINVTNGKATGNFETTTGDYRYLQGAQMGDSLWLSCFDGAHLFLFTAHHKGDSLIQGRFWSGGTMPEHWAARLDSNAKLPDALTLSSRLTDVAVHISVLDTSGKLISIDDPRYRNKAVIIQVMGSWCPNCMDETNWLTQFYADKPADLEVLALAFERKPDIAYWSVRIKRIVKVQHVPYQIGYAGMANTDSASKRLPFITGVKAFPTTIFLNRAHIVAAIHTGYSGPATGSGYNTYKHEFANLVNTIIKK